MIRNIFIVVIALSLMGYVLYEVYAPAPKVWSGQVWVSTTQISAEDLYANSYTLSETCKVVKIIDKDVVYVSYPSKDTCIANEECFLFNARRIY